MEKNSFNIQEHRNRCVRVFPEIPDADIATLCNVADSSDIRARLQLYKDAEAKILGGQLVRMGERTLQFADLAEVRKAIDVLTAQANREDAAKTGRGGRFSQADFSGPCR